MHAVVCMSLLFPTNGVISYSDPTLGENTVAAYIPVTLATLSMEAAPALVGVESGVGQFQLVKVL